MTTSDQKTRPINPQIEAVLQQAAENHAHGNLRETEQLYRAILLEDPQHPDANHNLGVLTMQTGNNLHLALSYFKTAMEADLHHAQYRTSYIRALSIAGLKDAAQQTRAEGRFHGWHDSTLLDQAKTSAPPIPFPMIEIVSATRFSEQQFWREAALGISLRRLARDTRISAHIAFANRDGLSKIFNARISVHEGPDILAFMHDDVWIDDHFFPDRVIDGLEIFDVIGIAGNRRRVKNQSAWPFLDDQLTWDDPANLCGRIAHGERPFGTISSFGPASAACELMDGVFLAARKSTLRNQQVAFDPRFDFHFYDMDFCRSARRHGLRLGTWPICLTHQSEGGFDSPGWREKYRLYLDKWGD